MPAAWGRMTGKTALSVFLAFRFFGIAYLLAGDDGPGRENGHSPKRDRRRPIQPAPDVTTALSTRPGTRLATGLDSSIARPALAAGANDNTNHTCSRSLPAMASIGGRRARRLRQEMKNRLSMFRRL